MRTLTSGPWLAVCLLAWCGCTRTRAPDREKILNWWLGDDLKTMDPALSTDRNAYSVLTLSLESLYQFNYRTLPPVVEPLLAEALPTISPDRLTSTIRIKKGVRFQDDPCFPNGRGF